MSEPTDAIAEIKPQPEQMPVALYGIYQGTRHGELMSFDPSTPEGNRYFLMATLGEPLKLGEHCNIPIELVHFYAGDASRAKDDGEVDEWVRIVLFTADGKAYSCGSQGVAKSLYVFARSRPILPWNPPIKCTPRTLKTGNGKNWMILYPNEDCLLLPTVQPQRSTGKHSTR